MSLERLWAGWRSEYISSAGESGGAGAGADVASEDVASEDVACVFCRILSSSEPDEVTKVVWRGGRVVALLNAYPYTSGHLMVLPERHVGEPESLETEEATELWSAVTDAIRAVRAAYEPEGLNFGANIGKAAGAGVPGHFHVHLLPRWHGDTNFMTTVAEARVLPESLDVTWQKLTRSWPKRA